MRIISQIVPNGTPVATDIEATRQPGETSWELVPWGRPLALGVYPLFTLKEKMITPIGTTFCISKLGLTLTAFHNLREILHPNWDKEFTSRDIGDDIGIAIFHHRVLQRKSFSGSIVSVRFTASSPATDICYLFPQFQSGSPYLPLPVSFAIPPIGSRVVCVGFSDLSAPDWSISLDDLQAGRVNLLEVYKHKFLAVEGRVSRIFTHGFGDGAVGPCFTVDAKITNGMTGGPVFSENGYACGVISAVAADPLEEPAGIIVSLLYPALAMNIRFGGHIRGIRVSSNLRLTDLITQGTVITDGTEDMDFYEA